MYTITSSAGNVIKITYVKDYLPGVPQFDVVIDGETVTRYETITRLGKPIEANGKTVVGVIDIRTKGKKSGVGLTDADVTALHAEAEANRTDEERAEIAFRNLRSQRESLVRSVSGWMAEVVRDDLYESEHEHVNRRRQDEAKAAEPKLAEAQDALRAFDAEHPEVLAAIKAEDAASVERNRWM